MTKLITADIHSGFLNIHFTNHEKRNPLSMELIEQFSQILSDHNGKSNAIVIYCSSAGADLKKIKQLVANHDELGLYHYSKQIGLLFKQISLIEQPCICLAENYIFGGAFGVMLACDLVLANAKTQFGLPEAHYGITPSQIFFYLEQRLGYKKSLARVTDCQSFNTQSAYQQGLVDRILTQSEQVTHKTLNWTKLTPNPLIYMKNQNKKKGSICDDSIIEQSALTFAQNCLKNNTI